VILTKQELLAKLKRRVQIVPVDGFGDVAFLEMSVKERLAFNDFVFNGEEKGFGQRFATTLVAMSLCDADGNRLFDEPKAALELYEGSENELIPLVDIAKKINRFGKEGIDDAEKNSETTQSEGSSSS